MTSAAAPADRLGNSADTPTTTEGTAMTTPITAAIANARDVYESVPGAGKVLDFLEATLAADAEAQATIDWHERAMKAEAALAAAPFEPIITEGVNVVCTACGNTEALGDVLAYSSDAAKIASVAPTADGADQRTTMLQLAAEVADSRSSVERAYAEQTQLRDQNHKLNCELAKKNKQIHQLEQDVLVLFGPAGGANASIAEAPRAGVRAKPVVASSWTIGGQPSTNYFDKVAAKMAEESAKSLAHAQRIAARAATGPVVADLVLKIDTSAIAVALTKIEQLKAALAEISPNKQ